MAPTDRAWHYTKPLTTTRMPRHHAFMDVEARSSRFGGGWVQTWRVGVVAYHSAPKGKPVVSAERVYDTPADLWTDLTSRVPRKGRLVLWAHNLAYDVRVSQALTILPGLGWRLTQCCLTPGATWLQWAREGRSLVMVDSRSVFPAPLADLGATMGMGKPDLPDEGAPADRWVARCRADVHILRSVVLRYLDRLERLDLGDWRVTGGAQAWAAFRRRHLTHQMLVHWHEDARGAERVAMWTGRCEAYWHGHDRLMTVEEWDMTLAYPRAARDVAVPTALVTVIRDQRDLAAWLDRAGHAVLAVVDVVTEVPLVPASELGRILWPVGSFRTTLWDPELRLLLDAGARVTFVRGWAYRAAPALRAWAEWVMSQLADADRAGEAWWGVVIKSWARSTIGRMAMSYKEWERVATAPTTGLRSASYRDMDTGMTGEMMQVGQDLFVATSAVEWPGSMPSVTGYIQSTVRAWLSAMLAELPAGMVLYADTDSLLTPAVATSEMEALARRWRHTGLRLKRVWRGVEILGPRQIITGTEVRVSGVSKRGTRTGARTVVGERWESLAKALASRRATSVRVTPTTWTLRGVDTRRDVGVDGWTAPVRLSWSGENGRGPAPG